MTTDYCRATGPGLVDAGYFVVPIRQGEKRPAVKAWQAARLTSAELQAYPGHGVGVLCGQGGVPIVGVDVDISHPGIGPAVLDWCRTHLGDTAERVGAAPRTLLVYRAADAGWAKGVSVRFFDPTEPVKPSGKRNEQQVELLGLGQQFVAYHVHPDTGRPYEWTDLVGGLEHWPATALPVVTEAQLDALLVEVARLVREATGLDVADDGASPRLGADDGEADLLSLSARVGKPIAEMRELMRYLDNEADHYDVWVRTGAALHHEYSGTDQEDEALALWREYGSKSSKDQPSEYAYKWASFGRQHGAPTTLKWLLKVAHQAKSEAQFDQLRSIKDQALRLIAEQTDSLQLGSAAVVRQLQNWMPADTLLRQEIVSAWQARYKVLAKATIPVGQVRALLLGAPTATVQQKRPLTEFGNAERMLDRFGESMMYVPETDSWYLWTGILWRHAVRTEIEHLAKETIRELVNEAKDHEGDQGEFFAFCAASQHAVMVQHMVKLASSDPRVFVPARELDKHTHLLGVKNGVVDLHTGELLPPNPEYRITLSAATVYDPAARCPLFERTVEQVFFGDRELVDYFVRVLGYALLGNPREEVMFLPYGNGANGKSTILNAVREMLGAYARSAEASTFLSDDSRGGSAGGPREDLLRLRHARLVYVNEPEENGELKEGVVKAMTGGDTISARGIRAQHTVEIEPTWVIVMPTNHKPIVKGGDHAIWRRLVPIPFTRNFSNDPLIPQDKFLKEKLLGERAGILTLLVKAGILYQRSGLTLPKAVRDARDGYRKDMDLLAEWLDECCDVRPGASCSMRDLWSSWELFAKSRGNLGYVKSSILLARRLDNRFKAVKGTGGVRLREGLALKVL